MLKPPSIGVPPPTGVFPEPGALPPLGCGGVWAIMITGTASNKPETNIVLIALFISLFFLLFNIDFLTGLSPPLREGTVVVIFILH
jgi:hypothetical protein